MRTGLHLIHKLVDVTEDVPLNDAASGQIVGLCVIAVPTPVVVASSWPARLLSCFTLARALLS